MTIRRMTESDLQDKYHLSRYSEAAQKIAWLVVRVDELQAVLQQVRQDMGVEDAPYYNDLVTALQRLVEE